MISPAIFRRGLLVTAIAFTFISTLRAQDTTPPIVRNPIADVVVDANSASTTININKVFGLNGVNGQMVRMVTNLGKIDLELFSQDAPDTVANFLHYALPTAPGELGAYTNTIFHRATTLENNGLAIIQGGGYTLTGTRVYATTSLGNVRNEYNLPNSRGTIAMAKLGGNPDSATNQWFINVSDNSQTLNESNNGGFTVFGRVIGRGMETADKIDALKVKNLASVLNFPEFASCPLYNYTDDAQTIAASNLVVARTFAALPMLVKREGGFGALTVKVKENSNPDLIKATVKGRKLVLSYTPGQTGGATITLQAKSAYGSKAKTSFNVTVR